MPRRSAPPSKLDAKLKLELHWLQRGVTARRRRNQGRLAKLHEMRAQRAAMLGPAGHGQARRSASDDVKTKIGDRRRARRQSASASAPIIKDFTLRIQRGDRIGVVGANGTGKTTLLKLLTGELAPDEGKVTLAKTLDGIVIDQQRNLIAPDKRVRDVLAEGGDWIDVRGVKKHVQGYLKEFLFDPGADRGAGRHAVGRRALAAAAGARIRARVEPAGARRADQRPRPRDARPAAGSDRRL